MALPTIYASQLYILFEKYETKIIIEEKCDSIEEYLTFFGTDKRYPLHLTNDQEIKDFYLDLERIEESVTFTEELSEVKKFLEDYCAVY